MTFICRQSVMSFLKITPSIYMPNRLMGFINNRSKYWLERIGNREMVCFGMNGMPIYQDSAAYPFSAIRYKETTPEIQALYEKQKGNWKLLTKAEKKILYRANFCQTFAEFTAPVPEWMEVFGYSLIACSIAIWFFIFMKLYVNWELPKSFKPSYQRAQMRRQLDLQINPVTGLSSNWDYEKNDWKVKRWNTPPNPFIKCPDDDE